MKEPSVETKIIKKEDKVKFKLTKTTKTFWSGTLYQIEATANFGSIKKGELGGWVEKEDNLSQDGNAWVYGDAWVYGNAWVYGDAWVYGNAQVYGDARVYGNARVYGDAWVYGNAQVYGDAQVYGNARVYGDAQVCGNAWVCGNARLEAKAGFKLGWFIGGDDTGKIKDITDKTGSDYWENQYVLGDYEIEDLEEKEEKETIKIGNNTYDKSEVESALKNVKSL